MKIIHVITSEKAVAGIDQNNSLTFAVEASASKPEIRKEAESAYGEKVVKVNVCISPSGRKKAIVKFAKAGAAAVIASKLKVI